MERWSKVTARNGFAHDLYADRQEDKTDSNAKQVDQSFQDLARQAAHVRDGHVNHHMPAGVQQVGRAEQGEI